MKKLLTIFVIVVVLAVSATAIVMASSSISNTNTGNTPSAISSDQISTDTTAELIEKFKQKMLILKKGYLQYSIQKGIRID